MRSSRIAGMAGSVRDGRVDSLPSPIFERPARFGAARRRSRPRNRAASVESALDSGIHSGAFGPSEVMAVHLYGGWHVRRMVSIRGQARKHRPPPVSRLKNCFFTGAPRDAFAQAAFNDAPLALRQREGVRRLWNRQTSRWPAATLRLAVPRGSGACGPCHACRRTEER